MTVVLHVQNGFHSGVDRGEKCPLKLGKEPNHRPMAIKKLLILFPCPEISATGKSRSLLYSMIWG